jgi:hypothetical protein
MKNLFLTTLILIGMLAVFAQATCAGPKHAAVTKTKRQIIVFASKGEKGITYRMNRQTYTGKELDYLLGEFHIDASQDSGVVVILDDSLALSDAKFVPAMALKAGFSDVRAFVYWEKTGRMAEVLFGPVIKYKEDAGKL